MIRALVGNIELVTITNQIGTSRQAVIVHDYVNIMCVDIDEVIERAKFNKCQYVIPSIFDGDVLMAI